MARFRLAMLPLNLLALLSLMALGTSASSADESSSSSSLTPSPSPPADTELICHTENPAECYPKLFQATDEFQVVHPDQDLPPGLHVRLDVNTGTREAKINVPDEAVDPSLAGLPVDSSIVIVEPDAADADTNQPPPLPPNAPAYDTAGKIKVPKPDAEGQASADGSAFYESLTILKKGLNTDSALEMLEDISHDIYYGLKIAEDHATVHELLCLATSPSTPAPRARLAALTLSSALQNNPKALAELERHWPSLSQSLCPTHPQSSHPLSKTLFTLPPPPNSPASLTKAHTSLLSSLLKSPLFRRIFLASSAPHDLLRILLTSPPADTPAWPSTQRTAAFLLLDNFLDPDMGATLDLWPSPSSFAIKSTDAQCAAAAAEEGEQQDLEKCLEWRVGKLREQFRGDGDHWSHQLGKRLKEAGERARKGKKKGGRGKDEL